ESESELRDVFFDFEYLEQVRIRPDGGRPRWILPAWSTDRGGRFLSEGTARGAGKRFWISFCVAACRDSTQSAVRVRPLARWQRLLDRSRLPPEPGAVLAEGYA